MKESILYKILRPFTNLFIAIIYHPKIKGREYLSDNMLLIGNHTSNLDCLALIKAVRKPIHFMAKIELFNGPFGFLFKSCGLIPVDRKQSSNKDASNNAKNYLKNGMNVLIFPEGTISKSEMLPFKMGAFKIANDLNMKVTPFVIKGKFKPFFNDLEIEFLEPTKIGDDLEKENKRIHDLIKKKVR